MKILRLVAILGFVFLLGCENKQLVQCRQDLAVSQKNLEKAQTDYAAENKISEQMLSSLMLQQQEEVKKLKKQIEQARLTAKAQEKALQDARAQREKMSSIMKKYQEIKDRENEINMQLAQAERKAKENEKKVTNSGDMLQALAAENAKLKAENKKLQGMIDELQKKLEEGKKGGDSGNIE